MVLLTGTATASAHQLIGTPEVGYKGHVEFSGGRYHSDAVRMAISVGSGSATSTVNLDHLQVTFRLDSFTLGGEPVCAFQLERGPKHPDMVGTGGALVTEYWPPNTNLAGYYDAAT